MAAAAAEQQRLRKEREEEEGVSAADKADRMLAEAEEVTAHAPPSSIHRVPDPVDWIKEKARRHNNHKRARWRG